MKEPQQLPNGFQFAGRIFGLPVYIDPDMDEGAIMAGYMTSDGRVTTQELTLSRLVDLALKRPITDEPSQGMEF
jgi:hypothetical protein